MLSTSITFTFTVMLKYNGFWFVNKNNEKKNKEKPKISGQNDDRTFSLSCSCPYI